MPASRHERAESRSALRCTACQARLAHDQRYCVDCGARRGPLPGRIARLIALPRDPGASAAIPAGRPMPELAAAALARSQESAAADDGSPWSAWISRPPRRAAAVAVMAVLSFGVIVGALVGGGSVESLAAAPLLLAVSPASQAPSPTAPLAASAAPSSSGAGGGGGGGGGGGSAPAAAPAATQPPALTVTVPAPSSPTPAGGGSPSSGLLSLPPIKHVFLIVLSNQGFKQIFGPSSHAGYLKRTLPRQGELLENYYSVAGGSLANEIALISGQGPTQQTAADCPVFANITPGTKGAEGQVIGSGCVYPSRTHTLANQLTGAGDTWKAYVAGLPKGSRTACRYPALGSNDPPLPGPRDSYVTWSNPFVYFQSLTGGKACRQNEVSIGQLATDLKTTSTTPSLSYIVPDACHDGGDQPCRPKAPSGLAPAEQFLRSVVPQIENSAAYKADGLIAITFDQAPQTGPDADPNSCCDDPTYPNLPSTSTPSGTGTTTTPGTTAPGTTAPGTTTPGTTTPGSATTTPGTANDTTVDTGTTPAGTTTGTTLNTGTTTTTTTAPTTTTGTVPIGGSPVPTPPASTPTAPTAGTPTTTAPVSGSPTATTPATTTTPTTTIPAGVGDGETNPTGGGGQVGLLLISPYVKPGSVDVIGYFNHFSLLATIENLFKVGHLGYTSDPALPVFDASVFNAPKK